MQARLTRCQFLTAESDQETATITTYDVDRKVNNTRTAEPTHRTSSVVPSAQRSAASRVRVFTLGPPSFGAPNPLWLGFERSSRPAVVRGSGLYLWRKGMRCRG